MKRNYIRPSMRVILINSMQKLLLGSGDRFYQEDMVDPEEAI